MLTIGLITRSPAGRTSTRLLTLCIVILVATACSDGDQGFEEAESHVFTDLGEASTYPGFEIQGEYAGSIQAADEKRDVGLQVAVYPNNHFRAVKYYGGLPGEYVTFYAHDEMVEMEGTDQEGRLLLEGESLIRFEYADEAFVAIDEAGNELGRLEKVHRISPTLSLEPPEGAVVLFDGTNLDHWDANTQMTEDGLLIEGARSAEDYADMRLHVEACLPFMPEDTNQGRSNSGIFFQNRYEVQILDSFGLLPAIDGNGSVYNVSAPKVNASYPPLTWQTYDVYFRAPRFDNDGNKTENARITAYLNGVLVQDDIELRGGTGRTRADWEEVPYGELYLQDHGGKPVRFRNVWLVDGEASPPGVKVLKPDKGE